MEGDTSAFDLGNDLGCGGPPDERLGSSFQCAALKSTGHGTVDLFEEPQHVGCRVPLLEVGEHLKGELQVLDPPGIVIGRTHTTPGCPRKRSRAAHDSAADPNPTSATHSP
ncbi:MAG TPA: hypothetical protein VHN80_31400, partial [Kineosporiaceae bacterium]|nr:hypothetical protein [Kineosporiaceae bacterium]